MNTFTRALGRSQDSLWFAQVGVCRNVFVVRRYGAGGYDRVDFSMQRGGRLYLNGRGKTRSREL